MLAKNKAKISSYSFTHIGKVREDNEDSLRLCNPEDEFTATNGYLYCIADGMGGYALGSKASSLAVETFFDTFYDSDGATIIQKIKAGIQNANLSVYQTSQKLGVGRMGTTLTAINLVGNSLYIGHVGDTRAYLIRNNKATCLTRDHTQVGELVRMKVLTKDKVRRHSQRSVLNKCLGFNLFIQPDIFKQTVQNNDVIIMCSDGVWAVIEDDEFAELTESTRDAKDLSKNIGELALERDHDDNLSVIVVNINELQNTTTDEGKKGVMLFPRLFNRFVK
jgi:serine/threonine protein phosphatase PrpC